MNLTVLSIFIAIALSASASGCSNPGEAPQSLPTVSMKIGKQIFTIEVADDEKSREIGLMHRDSMPADHGMIFIFPRAQTLNFWMKNTHIPLDIIYLGEDRRVVSIHQMEPFDLRGTSSDYPAQYAIELNQGAAAIAGVKVGDVIEIPPLPKHDAVPASKPSGSSPR